MLFETGYSYRGNNNLVRGGGGSAGPDFERGKATAFVPEGHRGKRAKGHCRGLPSWETATGWPPTLCGPNCVHTSRLRSGMRNHVVWHTPRRSDLHSEAHHGGAGYHRLLFDSCKPLTLRRMLGSSAWTTLLLKSSVPLPAYCCGICARVCGCGIGCFYFSKHCAEMVALSGELWPLTWRRAQRFCRSSLPLARNIHQRMRFRGACQCRDASVGFRCIARGFDHLLA